MTERNQTSEFVEQRGPIKVMSREVKHDRFGMQFYGDKVINPDGSEGEQFWINFPRQAVLIFPLDNEGNIYLTEEFTYGTNRYSTEVAGGSPDIGESIEDAAKREVKEEIGVEVESLGYMGTNHEITSRVNNTTHLFLAKVKSVGESNPESGEVIRLKKVPFDRAYQMALDGEISTGSIKLGIFQIKLLLKDLSALGK